MLHSLIYIGHSSIVLSIIIINYYEIIIINSYSQHSFSLSLYTFLFPFLLIRVFQKWLFSFLTYKSNRMSFCMYVPVPKDLTNIYGPPLQWSFEYVGLITFLWEGTSTLKIETAAEKLHIGINLNPANFPKIHQAHLNSYKA